MVSCGKRRSLSLAAALAAIILSFAPAPRAAANALVSPFAQGVAESAAREEPLAAFYRTRNFDGIWTGAGPEAQARRNAFLGALAQAEIHGLPAARFSPDRAMQILRSGGTAYDAGRAEVEMTKFFLAYARALNTGLISPRSIDENLVREVLHREPAEMLARFVENPEAMLHGLPPSSPEYQRLMRAKMHLTDVVARGGFGPGVQGTLRPGDSGDQVVRLRDRLIAMGLLAPTVTRTYDSDIAAAVLSFQETVGLEQDGVVGGATLTELNTPAAQRLESVLVAMERERWLNNVERGDRYVWVNLTDFTAKIMDFDTVTFQTKSVIGAGDFERQTYEFSDMMEYMEINPYWYVPRSIIVGEYGNRVPRGFEAVDARGRVVQTRVATNVNVRQPPGPGNAWDR